MNKMNEKQKAKWALCYPSPELIVRERSLIQAIIDRNMKKTEMLVDLIKQIDVRGGALRGALRMAILLDWGDAVDLFSRAGVSLGGSTLFECTPLSYAVFLGRKGIVDRLIRAGVNVDEVSRNDRCVPLCAAVRCLVNQVDIVRSLLEAGADANAQGKLGCQILHNAVEKGNVEVVQLLLEAGADVERKNAEGTPLDIARKRGCKEIVDLLTSSHAEKRAKYRHHERETRPE